MAKKKILTKDEEIKKEIKRLNKILGEVEKNKKEAVEGLIQEVAFMRATLQELKAMIDENGPIDEMPQGEYSILREHPALKSYNSMIQRYTTACKEIFSLLPKDIKVVQEDEFDEFINNRAD